MPKIRTKLEDKLYSDEPIPMKVYTEEELMDMPIDELKTLVDTLNIEIPEEGKNTNKKLRGLVLETQEKISTVDRFEAEKVVTTEEEDLTTTEKAVEEEVEKVTTSMVTDFNSCTVTISKGVTKNMGDFNSARVDVGITLPINPSAEMLAQAEETMGIAITMVDSRLAEEVNEIIVGE